MKTISQLRQSPANKYQRRLATRFLCLFVGFVLEAASIQAAELEEYPDVAATPPLALEDLGGNSHTLADYRGKVVLVNFWASWCPPCIHEMPGMQRLQKKLAGQPFVILPINVGEKKYRIWKFVKLINFTLPVPMDTRSKVFADWGASVLPTSFLLDTKGRIRYRVQGDLEWGSEEVISLIEELLNEEEHKQ